MPSNYLSSWALFISRSPLVRRSAGPAEIFSAVSPTRAGHDQGSALVDRRVPRGCEMEMRQARRPVLLR